LLLAAVACTFAYFFVDRQVAFFVHDRGLSQYQFLKWLTYTPDPFTFLAPVILVICIVYRAHKPLPRFLLVLFAASLSLMVTEGFLAVLKGAFGRYWPNTWIDHNPSLIENGAYGFHLFHYGWAYASFPSGHTARTVAVLSVLALSYPKWQWICVLVVASVIVVLVGMNYHFVGDTIAGAVLGSIIGEETVYFFCLRPGQGPSSAPAVAPLRDAPA
jgi:membrane-associated phospholipid phosphatase